MDRDLRIRMVLEAADRFTRPVRDMANGTGKLAATLKVTRDRIKDVERAQADLNGFRKLKRGMDGSGEAMRQAQTRAAALGREIADTEKPTRGMLRTFNAAKRQAAELEQQHQRNSTELGKLRDRLGKAGIATTDLVRHERRLRDEAAGLNRELSEQGRRMVTLNDRTRRLATARAGFQKTMGAASGVAASGTAAIGTGIALAAPIVGSVKTAQDYQSVMTDIAQKANLTRREADALGKQLLVNARAANQLPAEMQAGVDTLTGFGATVPTAVAMMRPIGRAATAYKAEIADLSAAAFAVSDNLKVLPAETGRVLDVMAAAGKAGAFEMKDMATYFPALTAGYQGLGQTGVAAAADIAAALQITRKGAGSSEVAATNLQNVLQKMASPDTIRKFAKFGVDLPAALKRAYAEGKTPIEAIAELTNKTLGGDLGRIGFLFEDAQVQQGLRPLIQNLEEYRRIRAEAGAATGTTDRDFAERMKDSAEQSRQLQVNAQTLGVQLGSTLLPAVNAVLSRVTAFAMRLSAWAQANPGFAKGLTIAAAAFAALFLVLGGGAIIIAGLLAPFAALSFAAGALGLGLLPVIGIAAAVVAGIAAVAAVAYLIYANWGAIGTWFSDLWAGVKGIFSSAGEAITGALRGMWTGMTGIVSGAARAVTGALGAMWAGVKALFSVNILDVYRSLFFFTGYALGAIVRFGTAAFDWLTGTLPALLVSGFSAAWSGLTAAIGAAGAWLTTQLPAILARGWSTAWNGLTAAIGAAGAWLTTRLPQILANGWNTAWSAFKAAMRAAFVTLPAMFYDFGAMIISGLWNGIKAAPGRLWAAGKSLAGSLANGFKAGAGIRSPSRVFAALGGHIIGGLNLGLDRGGGGAVDRIARLTRNMAAAATIPALSVAIPAQAQVGAVRALVAPGEEAASSIRSTSPRRPAAAATAATARSAAPPAPLGPITININGAPPAAAADIADEVRRVLEDLRRDEAARARSTFRDRQDQDALD